MNDKYTILYVDDEEANLRVFKNIFRKEFNILTATSGIEGIHILKTQCIDVIITDQRMPEMTGVEFLKEIMDMFPEIPPNRLIVSGYAKDEDIDEAYRKYKLLNFISKPWDTEELKQIILTALNKNI